MPADIHPDRPSREMGRVARLELPERQALAGASARQADIDLLANAPAGFLDTTHFDTVRFPPPPWALQRFSQAASNGALAYSGYRGHSAVLGAVAETVSRLLQVSVDPSQNLVLTPGTQAGLFASLSATVEAGDRVALFDPDYLFSARILRFLDADVTYIPMRLHDPGPDFERLEHEFEVKGTRFLVFSHPNNPSGAVFSKATISRIAELAVRFGVTVLIDELYARLLHDSVAFAHLAAEPGMAERTITLLGPSKTESLSGYRLGVVVGPAAIMRRIENVVSIMALRAPAYAQHVLVPWMRDDHAWLAERMSAFTALRTTTVDALRRLPWLKVTIQSGTAYVWPDVSALRVPSNEVAQALLRDAGVLVSPGYQFGPGAGGHFRLCYARDEAEWIAALERMTGVLDRLARPKGLPPRIV